MSRPFPLLVRVARLVAILCASVLPSVGCDALERIERAQALHGQGRFPEAYATLADPSAAGLRSETRDRYLWLLEEAKCGQDDRRAAESARTFLEASEFADRLDREWDRTSVGEELAAAATNQRVRVFRGSYSDRIQAEIQRTLACLLAGDRAGAGVAARRAIERQRDAEVDHAKRIAEVRKEIDRKGGASAVGAALRSQGTDLDAAAGLVLNPEASFLDWLVQSSTGDGNDRQRADTSLRRAIDMAPGCATLPPLLAANPFDLARAGEPQVVVVLESGSAPRIDQITIPLVTPWLGLTAIPLPVLRPTPPRLGGLELDGRDGPVRTGRLVDLNAIVASDFAGQLPEIILRTAVSVAAKEAATYAAYDATRANSGAQIGVLVAASIYKAIAAQADLRTWRTLPAEVSIAVLPRPRDGILAVRGLGSSASFRVELPECGVCLVWVRAVDGVPPTWAVAPLEPR